MKFIDEAKIKIIAGHGGPGAVSFRREKFIPRGGPDGGHGGAGGSVVFRATSNMSTLMDFRYKKILEAQKGHHGMGGLKDGCDGDDLVVPVPVGTMVFDEETGELIHDFKINDEVFVMAKGGRGGKGNSFFTTSTRQAPMFSQEGEEGEIKDIRLELKLLADVGLIGFPNAGKSTLLSVVSHAKPKVADYPFTTLTPCLGVVTFKDADPFVITDLPGLIEGAHEGKGMGDKFLKHAERTRILLHLVSLSPFETEEPLVRFDKIENEIALYAKDHRNTILNHIHQQKRIILLTQIDLRSKEEVDEYINEFKKHTNELVIPISSATRFNVDLILQKIVEELKNA